MSFSSDAKNEVVKSDLPQDECCARAELSALFRTCGGLGLENGKYSLELITEIADLYSRVLSLTKMLYKDFDNLVLIKEQKSNNIIRYHIVFDAEYTQKRIKSAAYDQQVISILNSS